MKTRTGGKTLWLEKGGERHMWGGGGGGDFLRGAQALSGDFQHGCDKIHA